MTERPLLYVLRHGETDWNLERRLQGQTDTPLNATGRAQAYAMAEGLARLIERPREVDFVTSPLSRAVETMEVVAQRLSVSYRREPRLIELSFGACEGLTWPELNRMGVDPDADPDGYHDWRPDRGESYADAAERIGDWLAGLERPTVLVSHGAVSRVLRGVALGLGKREVVLLPVPQDRFFRIAKGSLEWFDAPVAPSLESIR
ncbi:MAG: histidine phosphatase family protein [Parvibaculaceae bacterium]